MDDADDCSRNLRIIFHSIEHFYISGSMSNLNAGIFFGELIGKDHKNFKT